MVFADEIDDAPASIPLLYVLERERGNLRPPQPATEKHGEYRAVPEPLRRLDVRRAQERLCLVKRQPVAGPDCPAPARP